METLTKKEEEVMQILWKLKEAFVKDVITEMAEPKPPYNTISSIVRILEKKGFIDHKAFGKTHLYFPIINKAKYRKSAFTNFLSNYFEGSYENVVSFMMNDQQMSDTEAEELKKIIDDHNPNK